jgi:thiamine pyrophosphokinase
MEWNAFDYIAHRRKIRMRYFSIFWSKSQTYWEKLDNMIFSVYWRKTTQKTFHPSQFTRKMSTIFVLFICSLNEEGTIQRRKYPVTYLFVMIRKSVTISNMAISNETLNGRKPSLSAWSLEHFNKPLRCR